MDQPRSNPHAEPPRRSRWVRQLRWLKTIGSGIVPGRASTQTWMMLTFGFFVGLAAVAIYLYFGFVLRAQVNSEVRRILIERAERIADRVEQVSGDAARQHVVEEAYYLTSYQVVVVDGEKIYAPSTRPAPSRATLFSRQEMREVRQKGVMLVHRLEPGGEQMYYVAIYRPASGLIVNVGQPDPPLMPLVRRVEWSLIISISAVLLLAMLGSWIAARHVVRPLQAIRDSARRISEGNYDERIRVESRAVEYQELGRRLNHMAAAFREKIDELQRLAQLQNEFIGNVSHEVRNPIFAVGGYLEALGTTGLKEDQRKRYVEKGLANLQRLNNLFNDLIEIARLEYREDLIQPRVFELQELLDEIGDMLRPKAEEKGLQLELDNVTAEVFADRNRIRQVLINLIDNAIAYSDQGTVRCRYRRHLNKVRIEVIDTGRGIPEDHLDRIFERFYRVDPDRSRKSGGTGLGLSIVKQILHAHGEAIHVESTFGRGTRFWFELPLAGQTESVAA